MYFPKVSPKGAMITVEEVQAKINGVIYSSRGVSPSVYAYDLSKDEYIIAEGNDRGSLAVFKKSTYEQDREWCGSMFFLTDYNVGANYNGNFLFANEEDAEAYCQFCKTDPETQAYIKYHHAECDRWDDYNDRDYDDE